MAAFKVLETQFHNFIKSQTYLDDEYVVMTRKYFLEYTQLEIREFRDTLIQHMEYVMKSIDKRALHKREYDSWVNERQMQTTEGEVDTSKALDASMVNTESSGTASREQDTNSRPWNDAHANDADIRPIYDEEPMAEGFSIVALKNELRKLKGNSMNTKFAKSSILEKPVLQPHRNQSVVRQPTAFKSERPRISKPRFSSQVDVNNDLSKPITIHYFPKGKEPAYAKPHHMIAPGSSRYRSNDMVHNHYLEEVKKQIQEIGRNSKTSVMPFARSQSTSNDCNPKPRSNTQTYRNWPASKSSCVTTKTMPIADHSRNSSNFSDSKYFVCSTCQKCVFNANHDARVTKFLNEIPKGHRFSIKKTSVVHEKTMNPRSCLRWKPTGKVFNSVGLRWVPIGKIFTSSTTTVESEPPHGSNTYITNLYECIQTLDSSAGTSINVKEKQTLDLNAGTPFNLKKERIKSQHQTALRSYALSWKPCQGDSLNLPDHRYKRRCCILIPTESNSLPHAHAQTTKTYYKHQDSRIKKAQDLKTKTFANSDIQDIPLRYQVYQGRLLASF
ncbi:hypothetical protein Tco_0727833 [Tanacetum coccineum]|uniref:Uncharacterized protein n=1 Tax=Tanacetum coccineum TaxID=301880 RepID=A0ABQ4YM18_9ASTR